MRTTNPFHELLSQQGIMPMEAMSWTKQNAKSIQIALPKETAAFENRISLTPQAVQLLVANGHEVIVENGAGERAGFQTLIIYWPGRVLPMISNKFGREV